MFILKSSRFKQCRDGTVIYEFHLDSDVTLPFVQYLCNFGELKLLDNMDPPFYTVTVPGYFTMKGLVTEKSAHVKFKKEKQETAQELFQSLLSHYKTDTDIEAVKTQFQNLTGEEI